MAVQWLITARKAREIGCTHHGRLYGIVPGFIEPDTALWVSRSDLLIPLEGLLDVLWWTTRWLRGEDPDFMFTVGEPLDPVDRFVP